MSDLPLDTTVLNPELAEASLIADYLSDHPEFFLQHPELLSRLRLPHPQKGTVSLVERQLELQREKIRALEDDITRLMGVARQNEQIFYALNDLHLELLKTTDQDSLLQALLAFTGKMPQVQSCKLIDLQQQTEQVAQLQLILQRRLSGKNYYFGRLNRDEMAALFEPAIHSVSLQLLKLSEQQQFLLAFGSDSDEHFQPGMDTLFLDHLAKLVLAVLPVATK
jgi:uncharacterized protein YigA (DUF484 family)